MDDINDYLIDIEYDLQCLEEDYKKLKIYYNLFLNESNNILLKLSNLTHIQIACLIIKLKCDYIIYGASQALKNT